MSKASESFTVQANPRHRGWRCLRCNAQFERCDLLTGCPRCAADGHASNVSGDYDAAPSLEADPHTSGIYRWGPALPYLAGVTLGEANTPLVALPRLAQALQLASLELKNESANPTGSHKDRMSVLAITRALETGAKRVVLASSGNAGVSAACYAAAAGLACDVATFQDVSPATERILRSTGARMFQFATGMERWRFVEQQVRSPDVYPLTNYVMPAVGSQPFGVEGYRTIAYELHAQCAPMPQHIVVPTARGDLLSGLAHGLRVLQAAGRIDRLPRLWAVEPFARLSAVLNGADYRSAFDGQSAQSSIAGNTVTWQALQALQVSAGGAVVVDDAAARQAWHELGENGWPAELCAAAPLSAVRQLMKRGEIAAGARVLMVFTARADRDSTLSAQTPPRIDTKGHA